MHKLFFLYFTSELVDNKRNELINQWKNKKQTMTQINLAQITWHYQTRIFSFHHKIWFSIFLYFEITSENIFRLDVPLHLYKKLLDRVPNIEKYHICIYVYILIDIIVVFY